MERRTDKKDRGAGTDGTLRERAAILESILNGVSLLISYIDKEERYVFVNRAYAWWHDIRPEEAIGKRVSEILKPEEYSMNSANINKALHGQPAPYDNELPEREGRE